MSSALAREIAGNAKKYFDGNYLDRCQVATPIDLVHWFWKRVHEVRPAQIKRVLDLGCGDARFSRYGEYDSYVGVEIDSEHDVDSKIPKNVEIDYGCALLRDYSGYDVCIGNPPYVRHHDMDSEWQRAVAAYLSKHTGDSIDLRANAFLYFMLKALLSTSGSGLVALIVPFEWVSRPSSRWVREYISNQGFSVEVYRLPEGVFPSVLTTASLTIVDKTSRESVWQYFAVDKDYEVVPMSSPSGTCREVIEYSRRSDTLYAQRGLSPGGQKIFCLTEEERLHNRLRIGRDVVPCVTSLKQLPSDVKMLTKKAFDNHFVSNAARCWLIRSDKLTVSDQLMAYLNSVDSDAIDNSTCNGRETWYQFKLPDTSQLLFSTGFVSQGPQVVENQVSAIAVGAVGGIFGDSSTAFRRLAAEIRDYDFESGIVNHSGQLRKIEINQMNSVLREIYRRLHGRTI